VERCDVLVVGGGPAGSTCAWRLRRAGLNVRVLDRARFPRDKLCAGWVTPQVLESLQLDVEDYRRGRVFQPILGFRTSLIDGPEVRTSYASAVSYGIRRWEFDAYLLERSGAALRQGDAARLRRDGGDWVVDEAIRTPLLVGAGGHFCPVARALGGAGGVQAVVAQEAEFRLDGAQDRACPVDPQAPELYFCGDLEGYGWCFRKGDYLNVGFGRRDGRGFPAHVREFWSFLERAGKVPRGTPFPWRGHAYRVQGTGAPRVVADGVVLVGDAAGLAYAESGEGIRPAVESGLLAAEAILAAGGRRQEADLAPYRQALGARFGLAPPRRRGPAPPAAWRDWAGRRLLAVPWFARHVLLDRWFLHRRQPPLRPA